MTAIVDEPRYGWKASAGCRNVSDPDLFFRSSDHLEAKLICADCPVLELCRAVSGDEHYGTWAGEWRERHIPLEREPRRSCAWCGEVLHRRDAMFCCQSHSTKHANQERRNAARNGVAA